MTESNDTGRKDRPTPSRKEAQAARRARMKPAVTKKEQAARDRAKRSEIRAKQQAALKTGDDKYLPARDRGPKKRLIRDVVDRRWNISEFLLPILVTILILTLIGQPWAVRAANAGWAAVIVMSIVDTVAISRAVKKAVLERHDNKDLKGSRFYAILRSTQLRPLRLPKPVIKRGEPLKDRY